MFTTCAQGVLSLSYPGPIEFALLAGNSPRLSSAGLRNPIAVKRNATGSTVCLVPVGTEKISIASPGLLYQRSVDSV
jgi:hypothetical protein